MYKPRTVKEIKEEIKERYGYDGHYLSIHKLAQEIYKYLSNEETIRKHKLNIYSNDRIIKISVTEINRVILDERLNNFLIHIVRALRVLQDMGLIEIIDVRGKKCKTKYIIRVK